MIASLDRNKKIRHVANSTYLRFFAIISLNLGVYRDFQS